MARGVINSFVMFADERSGLAVRSSSMDSVRAFVRRITGQKRRCPASSRCHRESHGAAVKCYSGSRTSMKPAAGASTSSVRPVRC